MLRHRSENLNKHLPPKFPYCSTNEGTSSSSPISCLVKPHVFRLEKWILLKHLMPPYWSDMSDIYFLWLHASQSDGSLFLTVYKAAFVRLFEHSHCLNVRAIYFSLKETQEPSSSSFEKPCCSSISTAKIKNSKYILTYLPISVRMIRLFSWFWVSIHDFLNLWWLSLSVLDCSWYFPTVWSISG